MRDASSLPARRQFIVSAGALCAGTVVQSVSASASLADASVDSLPRFCASRFRACVGSEFQVQALGRDTPSISLSLSRVVASPFSNIAASAGTTATPASELAFSIDLVTAKGTLVQDTYAVSHPDMGEFIALLVPTANGRTLTGVFNNPT